MERARLHRADAENPQPTAKLAGGASSEREGQHVGWRDGASVDRESDAMGNRSGLAGARAGQNAHRPANGLGRLTLLSIEVAQEVGAIWAIGQIGESTAPGDIGHVTFGQDTHRLTHAAILAGRPDKS